MRHRQGRRSRGAVKGGGRHILPVPRSIPCAASSITWFTDNLALPGELDLRIVQRVPGAGIAGESRLCWRVHGRGNTPRGMGRAGYDFLHVAIDDHTRIAFVQFRPDEKGTTCAEFIGDAFAFYAQLDINVERAMTDNAKNYVLSAAFQAALGDRRHKRTRPPRPQTNATPSGSTEPCSRSGPTPACSPATTNVPTHSSGARNVPAWAR